MDMTGELQLTMIDNAIGSLELLHTCLVAGADPKVLLDKVDANGELSELIGTDASVLSLEELKEKVEEQAEEGKKTATKKRGLVVATAASFASATAAAVIVYLNKKASPKSEPTAETGGTPPRKENARYDAQHAGAAGKLIDILEKVNDIGDMADLKLTSDEVDARLKKDTSSSSDRSLPQPFPAYAEFVAKRIETAASKIRKHQKSLTDSADIRNLSILALGLKQQSMHLKSLVENTVTSVALPPSKK